MDLSGVSSGVGETMTRAGAEAASHDELLCGQVVSYSDCLLIWRLLVF